FRVHSRLKPMLERRVTMVENDRIDWALAETLAFGSLLMEGHPVRLAGQDSRRGTFGQRHAVLVDRDSGEEYTPLAHLSDDQAKFTVYDSLLSEYAAVGFEYGYSVARPKALVTWEAQFGDFVNNAQAIVDEFISSGEQKWGQRSGVTLLLPHGYEGQGPDHSSARIERFLSLCAQNNMTVAMPSLPSNYFHLLRWQARAPLHRPLIVFTPKSMLRLKLAISKREEFTAGTFRPVLTDVEADREAVRRVLLCSGKIYYDLATERARREVTDTAIIRVERQYPLPAREIIEAISSYPNLGDLRWVQEEPANQGLWPFMALSLPEHLRGQMLYRVSRPASSAPAVGSSSVHEAEQQAIIDRAFTD
ncbi:MAG: multifunctional oxoglutarate decarboxylase/oxoglutarate dehydrogenase thiamine pyrophosphate-binding subunit/dihydrolipoyllysine-residue succinyltransferase subunit, partial [Carbonactinosporaceae bacterium]